MSVRILGFDISTCTGYGFWDYSRDVSSIEADVIELPPARHYFNDKGEKKHDYNWDDWRVAQVGPKIVKLFQRIKPDFVLVEERLRFSKTGDVAFSMSNAIHGAIYSHCCSLNILFGTVPSQSWRIPAYGEGFKQPMLPALDRQKRQKIDKTTGKPEFKKKDWGDIAVEKCEELCIQIPRNKEISHNAAEAALISMMWRLKHRITVPSDRDRKRYLDLLDVPRNPHKEASADLFHGAAA